MSLLATVAAAPALLADNRRARILDWLREEGSARVRDLAAAFAVSDVTIRQDLERLEADGHLERVHGGAFLRSITQQVRAMSLQHQGNLKTKQRIGRAAAALVKDGETIILDSGSTTTEVAANLLRHRELTVITNGLNIALALGGQPSIAIHMPGGHFKAPTLSVSGEKSASYFEGLFAGRLFLATAAVSLETGLTFPSLADLPVKRAMIRSAQHVCLVADSSKIGKTSFTSLGPIGLINSLVTDDGISPADAEAFRDSGIEVIIA